MEQSAIYRRSNRNDSCIDKAKTLDLYKQPFQFLMPDDRAYYNTYLGAFLSLLTFVILLTYGTYKFISLV